MTGMDVTRTETGIAFSDELGDVFKARPATASEVTDAYYVFGVNKERVIFGIEDRAELAKYIAQTLKDHPQLRLEIANEFLKGTEHHEPRLHG